MRNFYVLFFIICYAVLFLYGKAYSDVVKKSSCKKLGSEIRVSATIANSKVPSIAWTGKEFGVVWSDDRDGNREVYFVRLDKNGKKLGEEVKIPYSHNISISPKIVWTGKEFGVVWEGNRDGNWEIYFARLDSSGKKIGKEKRITTNQTVSRFPEIVWAGDGYGVVWEELEVLSDKNRIYFTKLDIDGKQIMSPKKLVDTQAYFPKIIWNGLEFDIVWLDERDAYTEGKEVYFLRLECK